MLVSLYIGFNYWQRHRLSRELRLARITVDELRQKQEAGEDILILDLRSSAALQQDPTIIRGASHVTLEELEGGAMVCRSTRTCPLLLLSK